MESNKNYLQKKKKKKKRKKMSSWNFTGKTPQLSKSAEATKLFLSISTGMCKDP